MPSRAVTHEIPTTSQTLGSSPSRTQTPSRARERGTILGRLLLSADLVGALVAGAVACLAHGVGFGDGFRFVIVAALGWPLTGFVLGLYRSDQLASWASAINDLPREFLGLLVVSWPLYWAASTQDISDPVALVFITLLAIVLFTAIGRATVRATLHRSPELRQRTLILGSGVVAGQVVEKLDVNPQFGLDPVGLVDDEVHTVGTPDLPRLGGFADLIEVIEAQNIDRVIITFSRASHEQLLESIRVCRDAGVAINVVPRLFEFLDGVRALDQVGGLPLLSLDTPALSPISMAAKRLVDVVASGLLIVLTAPIMLAVAAAIKLESKGPVLFAQRRAGRRNNEFRLVKFRSMYADAEDRKKEIEELNESEDGVMFKIRQDPRVTRVGRFIRRFSLDELPQLFNVFKGEMSLVGPRPLIFAETAALEERWHLRRLELRPGITGPWQIYGRSESPFQEMVRFDYQYVAGWSLARDFEILLATIPAVISGRGAY
ncbi:MAG: exopolysaccharide biosynthesis polyprenyl glycosylphosphotransferase [Solirubrobacterales bacterium]|nr:exopolysaccharide biosynthesis polyprenyl glycosylphosphotransferase [Solirubrobacterales bacterium]